jgi:hypothetical protein
MKYSANKAMQPTQKTLRVFLPADGWRWVSKGSRIEQ